MGTGGAVNGSAARVSSTSSTRQQVRIQCEADFGMEPQNLGAQLTVQSLVKTGESEHFSSMHSNS
jgi:hypothetical protein